MDANTVLLQEAARLRALREQQRLNNFRAPIAEPDVLAGLQFHFGPRPMPPEPGPAVAGPSGTPTTARTELPSGGRPSTSNDDDEPVCRFCHCGPELGRLFSPW